MIYSNPADHPAWMAGWQGACAGHARDASRWTTDAAREIWFSGYDAAMRGAVQRSARLAKQDFLKAHPEISKNLAARRRLP